MAKNPRRASRPQRQGEDEGIFYSLDVSAWGSSPTNVAVTVKHGAEDVTAEVTTGTPVVAGKVITLPKIHGLTAGFVYRVEVAFTVSNNELETYFYIEAEE